MSRIGKLPVNLPKGVTVTVGADNVVSVKGPLGQLSQKVDPDITVTVEGDVVHVTRPTDQPRHRSMHGLYRALIANMVHGVSTGYETKQELIGVGFKAEAFAEKKGNPILTLKSADKQLLGQVAAKIRSLRKPEPYKGKGIMTDKQARKENVGGEVLCYVY